MISIKNNQSIPIDIKNLTMDSKKILRFLGYSDFDLGIKLVSNAQMYKLNKMYRNKDASTDILSFPYHLNAKAGETIIAHQEDDKNLGDLVLCPSYIQQDLAQWDQSFEQRLQILLVHGICHLLGYDHIQDTDYRIMHQKEKTLLTMLSEM